MLIELVPIADKLNEERRILNRSLDGLAEEDAKRIPVTPEWSVRDEVAHLAGAERGMLGMAQRISRGENPQLPEGYDNDTFNARQVAKRKEQTLAQIREELAASRGELLSLLESVRADQLALCGEHPLAGDVSLRDLMVVIYSHEMTHANEISNHIREAKR